jgi:hypothetical protein
VTAVGYAMSELHPAIFALAPAVLLLGGLALVYASLYAGVALRMAVDAVVDWWRGVGREL